MGGGGSHHLERSPNFYFFRSPLIDVPHPVTTAADNLPEQSGTRGARTNSLDQQHHHRYSCSHHSRHRHHCHHCHTVLCRPTGGGPRLDRRARIQFGRV